jgi:hypothetical protein
MPPANVEEPKSKVKLRAPTTRSPDDIHHDKTIGHWAAIGHESAITTYDLTKMLAVEHEEIQVWSVWLYAS